ncbi:Kelch repeat-containing protein [Actinophytocola gossypii]|uniref:Galactose oxidase n=1 Tax=Actinophytocola gossypii TaxID=2812003 RepID=A0ABT2J7N0_9PSEU|nr:kelch repeat-containing protein [Actinophytocola gossypii]MCT2583842.1 hypothetical protein [Actinophytocola gossypii]
MFGTRHVRRAVPVLAVLLAVPATAVATGATEGAPGERARWRTAAPMAVERQELYPEVVDGRIYVAGGLLNPNTGLSAHFEAYDPRRDRWNQLATLPEARHHITLAEEDGLIYGVGGFSGGFPNWRAESDTFVYDIAADRWTRGADLPVARAEGVSESVDGRIFYLGGRIPAHPDARTFNEHVDTTRTDVLDPATGTWTAGAAAPTARNSAASAVIDGEIYVVGGRQFSLNPDGTARQVNVPTLEVYDPATDTWETRAPMPEARGGLAATTYRGKLYVFGGEQWVPEQRVFDDAWVYDPRTDEWRSLPPLPTPRHGLGAATVGDRIHTLGGSTRTGGNFATDLNEVFLPRRGR